MRLLEENYLDKNISNRLSWLAPKIKNSQIYYHYDVAFFGPKNKRS